MRLSTALTVAAVFLLAGLFPAAFAEDAYSLQRAGRNLTPEEAAALEENVDRDAHDLRSRTLLLGYYRAHRYRRSPDRSEHNQNSRKHILWLIENAPEAEVLAHHSTTIDTHFDPEGYVQAKNAWLDQVESQPANLKILDHAAEFFLFGDRELAIELLQRAQSLDASNPQWPRELGHLYSLEMGYDDPLPTDVQLAEKALTQFEKAYELSSDTWREMLLGDLARAAFAANRHEKAREYAEAMLRDNDRESWNHGNLLHHGNIVLGRIALAEDNVEKAKYRLIAAGMTPGSPQLNSFGPNMTLAQELLEKGEKETVLEYFKLCSRFWKEQRHLDKLEEWTVLVEGDRMPDF